MFTGSPAPPTAHAQVQQQAHESVSEPTGVEVEEENGGDEDERLPDARLALASAAIPPSLDPVSESTEVDVEEENGDDEDERLPDALLASASAAIPPCLDSDSSSSATASGDPLPGSSSDPSPHVIHPSLQDGGPGVLGLAHPLFTVMQLGVDRRLLVNRKRQLKMYRVWMQGKFQRTEADGTPLVGELNAGIS